MKIYVGNLPFDATQSGVQELFSQYGQVSSISLKKAEKVPKVFADKGVELQFAFVNFTDSSKASEAFNKSKDDDKLKEFIHEDHDMRKEFIFFAQPKAIRTQFLKMQRKNMISSMFLQQQMMMMQNMFGSLAQGGNKRGHKNQQQMMMLNPMMMQAMGANQVLKIILNSRKKWECLQCKECHRSQCKVCHHSQCKVWQVCQECKV